MVPAMRVLRFLYLVSGFLMGVVLLAIYAAGGLVFLCRPLPQEDAAIPGLSAPVAIAFDGYGIPRIRAATAEDGAAALGWVHARDRLFQMDLMRRAASGRISELAGARALPLDRTMRVLGLRAPGRGGVGHPARRDPGHAGGLRARGERLVAAHGRWSASSSPCSAAPSPGRRWTACSGARRWACTCPATGTRS